MNLLPLVGEPISERDSNRAAESRSGARSHPSTATVTLRLGAGAVLSEQLTLEQYETLAAELAELEGPKRAEMVDAIKVARAHGDLSENFEYHAAKNEQGLLERRITILRARLDGAVIVEAGTAEVVSVGSHVTVANDAGEQLEVEISGLGGDGAVSPSSPLGIALLGKRVGDAAAVAAPSGTWTARVVQIRSR
jgi:transcription elongation factor GreA